MPALFRSVVRLLIVVASLTSLAPLARAQHPALPLEHVADIALPGPALRFDYQSFDPLRQRLYIAHMGAGRVLAVDVATHEIHVIPDMPDVHGVLAVTELGRVYATVTARNEVTAIDADTLAVLGRAPTGRYPDGIAHAPQARKLFVSNEAGGSDTVIDVGSFRTVATIALGGEVGNTQYDAVSQHIFANVQTTGELVEIDPQSHRIVARHRLEGARGNHGLYIDADRRLAFIACEADRRLITFDLEARKAIAVDAVGAGPDVLAFDPALRLLYVAAESGVVSMFREERRKLVKIGEALLAPGAHSVAVNAQTHDVYFPLKSVNGRPVLRVMRPTADLR